MSDADPSDIVVVDKRLVQGQRLKSAADVQHALDSVGSRQNIVLTELSRHRKVLFVEGEDDYRLLRRFAARIDLSGLASGNGLSKVESEGAGNWERIASAAWAIERALGTKLAIAVVFDRDYRCDEEISAMESELRKHVTLAHFHTRKEIENYLLNPDVIQRALDRASLDKTRRGDALDAVASAPPDARALLEEITAPMKSDALAQYIARRTAFLRHDRRDSSTLTAETLRWFEAKWRVLEARLEIVPGKDVLARLRQRLQSGWGVNITDARIVDAMRTGEVPADLRTLLESLNSFRATINE